MSNITIICLLGSASSGKSTTAEYLVRVHGFTRFRFAEPLKDMLMTLGLSREQVDGNLKEVACPLLCGKTPRHAMKTLGTEWRDMIGRALWAAITKARVLAAIETGVTKIVIDDMRFPHEAAMFEELGATLIGIRRPCVEPTRASRFLAKLRVPRFVQALCHVVFGIKPLHRSEAMWFGIKRHIDIDNTGPVVGLYKAVNKAIRFTGHAA